MITYIEFVPPEKTKLGRQSYHGQFELFRTDEKEKEFYSSIYSKVTIVKFADYVKDTNFKNTSFFYYRQKYDKDSCTFLPPLKAECYCNTFFNPDLPFVRCSECFAFYHTQCLVDNGSNECQECEFELNIDVPLLQKKRPREDKPEEPVVALKYPSLPAEANDRLIYCLEKHSLLFKRIDFVTAAEKLRNKYRDMLMEAIVVN